MTIDTDWQLKAEHWERTAKRLIVENEKLKIQALRDEMNINWLQKALASPDMVIGADLSKAENGRSSLEEERGDWYSF